MSNKTWNRQARLLRDARFNSGMSQYALAVALGMESAQMVSNIERGKCGIPARNIAGIAVALNIRSGEVIDRMVEDYTDYLISSLYERLDENTVMEKGV